MKKNLFLLFSIYFFVFQPVIIWILRGQGTFFRLWAINLVAIVLIGMLYNTVESSGWEEKVEHEKRTAPIVKEAKVAFHDHFRVAVKERKKKSELFFPGIIGAIVGILIYFMFQYNSTATAVILLSAISLGFIVYLWLTLLFKHRITTSFWRLLWTKIYIVALVFGIVLTAYDYYQVYKDYGASFEDYVAQNVLGQERIPTDGYVFTGEGSIIGSGLWSTTGAQDISTDMLSGLITSDIQEETGTVLWTSTSTTNSEQLTTNTISPSTVGNQKLMDAVIYLLKKYNIPLITKKDLTFTYVTTKNPYYAERRTAYANKLIWKTTNPSKYIVCESYIVMKWILEKRNVVYTSSNVLTKFRDEAVKRDALNGCVKGKIVTDKTL